MESTKEQAVIDTHLPQGFLDEAVEFTREQWDALAVGPSAGGYIETGQPLKTEKGSHVGSGGVPADTILKL
ncbi:MAG: hypothetical protein M3O20_15125 [Acidobacteriota bacterium]|nr:hypothetical protein [Acidobacteriota bacterium]